MSREKEPTWAEVDIVADDQAHLKVVFGIRASYLDPSVSHPDLLLHLEYAIELSDAVTGIEEACGNEKSV